MSGPMKTLVLWVVLIIVFVGSYSAFTTERDETTGHLSWAAFQESVDTNSISRVEIRAEHGIGFARAFSSDGVFTVDARPIDDFGGLESAGVTVSFSAGESYSFFRTFAVYLPWGFLLLFAIAVYGSTRHQRPDILRFEPATARVEGPVVLRGLTRERELLLSAARGVAAGNPALRRVLLMGPPGTGKTALLKAVAHDAGLPLLALPGSAFVEVFVGVGAARIRKVFDVATASQPCIVAIDDVDAFATRRTTPDTKGLVDERAATLLELANRLDGLSPLPPKVLFIATTSRPELLDEALTRPGRFDLTITLTAVGESTIDEPKPGGV